MPCLILRIYLCFLQITCTESQSTILQHQDYQTTLNKFYLETRPTQSINLENFKLSLWFRQTKISDSMMNEILSIKCSYNKMAEADDHQMNLVTIQEQQTLIKIIYLDDENTKQQRTTSLYQNQNYWIQFKINGLSSQEQIYFKIRLHSVEQNIEFTFQSSQPQHSQPLVEFSPQVYNYQRIKISEFSELQSNECVPGCWRCDPLNPFICHSCNQYEQRKQANCECLENKYQYDDLCISQLMIMQKQTMVIPIIQIYELFIIEGKYAHNGSVYQDCQQFLTKQTLYLLSLQVNQIELKISFTNQITNWYCQSPFFRIKLSLLQQEDTLKLYQSTIMDSLLSATYVSITFSQYYYFISTNISIVAEMVQLYGLQFTQNTQKVQIYFNKSFEAKKLIIQIYNISFVNASIDYSVFFINSSLNIAVYIENFKILYTNLTKIEHLFTIYPIIQNQLQVDLKYLTINHSQIDQYSLFQVFVISKFVIYFTNIQHSIVAHIQLFSANQIVSYDTQIIQTEVLSARLYAGVQQLQIAGLGLFNIIIQGQNANLIYQVDMNSVIVINSVIIHYLVITDINTPGLIQIRRSLGVLIKNFTILHTASLNHIMIIDSQKVVFQDLIFKEIVVYKLGEQIPSIIYILANSTRVRNMLIQNLEINGDNCLISIEQIDNNIYLKNVIIKNVTLSYLINSISAISDNSIILFENVQVEIQIKPSNSSANFIEIRCSQIIMKNSNFYFNHSLQEAIQIFNMMSSQILFERSTFSLDSKAPEQPVAFWLTAASINISQCNFSQITVLAQPFNIGEGSFIIINSQLGWNRILPNTKDIYLIVVRQFLVVDILNNQVYVNTICKQLVHLFQNIKINLIDNYFYAVSQNILIAFLLEISDLYIQNFSIIGMIQSESILDCQQYNSIAILDGQHISIQNLSQIRFNASLLYVDESKFLEVINIQVTSVFYTDALLTIQTSKVQNILIINNLTLIGIQKRYICQSNDQVNLITLKNTQGISVTLNNIQITKSSNRDSMIIVTLIENQAFKINNLFLFNNLCLTVFLRVILDQITQNWLEISFNQIYFLRNLGAKMMVITSGPQKLLLTNVVMNNEVLFYSVSTSQTIEVENIEIYEHQRETVLELFRNPLDLIKITYNSVKRLSYFMKNYAFVGRIIEVSFDDGITYYRNKILNSEKNLLQVQFYHKGVEKAYMYIPPYGYSLTNYSKFDYYHSVYNNYLISLRYKAAHSLKSSIFCALYINQTLQNYFDIENQNWSQLTIQYYEPYIIEFNVKCQDNDTVNSSILSLSFYAKQLHCQIGEINFKNKCIPCLKKFNQYSLAKNARYCKTFDNRTMQSAELCFITLRQGFWRADYKTDLIETCLLQLQTCNGGSNYGDQSCMQGYIGALCFECDSYNLNGYGNYYRGFNGSCSQDQSSLLTLMSLAFYIIMQLIYQYKQVIIFCAYFYFNLLAI